MVRTARLDYTSREARWTPAFAANAQRKRLRKEWPPWPIFCTIMATEAPRPIPATSSAFAHATSARSNRVVIENDDRMVLGLQDAAKGVVAAGRGGAGIANNVLLGVSDDCPASGHHARTQRGRQRVDPAYGTPAGCCTGARPGNTPQNNHNGLTTRARSAVCNANTGRATMCGRFRRRPAPKSCLSAAATENTQMGRR